MFWIYTSGRRQKNIAVESIAEAMHHMHHFLRINACRKIEYSEKRNAPTVAINTAETRGCAMKVGFNNKAV